MKTTNQNGETVDLDMGPAGTTTMVIEPEVSCVKLSHCIQRSDNLVETWEYNLEDTWIDVDGVDYNLGEFIRKTLKLIGEKP